MYLVGQNGNHPDPEQPIAELPVSEEVLETLYQYAVEKREFVYNANALVCFGQCRLCGHFHWLKNIDQGEGVEPRVAVTGTDPCKSCIDFAQKAPAIFDFVLRVMRHHISMLHPPVEIDNE